MLTDTPSRYADTLMREAWGAVFKLKGKRQKKKGKRKKKKVVSNE